MLIVPAVLSLGLDLSHSCFMLDFESYQFEVVQIEIIQGICFYMCLMTFVGVVSVIAHD